MKLIFIRHGESEANVRRIVSNRNLPHGLTEKGRTQVKVLADDLANRQVTAIYSSPILRAQETAEIIAELLGVAIQIEDALREGDCGILEGCSDTETWTKVASLEKAWDAGDHDHRIAEGESLNDIRARFEPFITQLINVYGNTDETIALISHGAVLHHMLPLVLTNIDRAFSQQNPLGNTACIISELQNDVLICLSWGLHKE